MAKPERGITFDTTTMLSAASANPRVGVQPNAASALPAAALAAASEPHGTAYSPIVIAGLVRLTEVLLVMAVGFGVYIAYVVPVDGFVWYYFVAIPAIAIFAMLGFQAADIYQVQAFRGHEKQYMRLASAWSVVFLIAICASFLPKSATSSRVPGSAASTCSVFSR